MSTQPTTTAPAPSQLNGSARALADIVQRLDEAATSSDWRAQIAGAIRQLQELLAGDDAPIWAVTATRPAGLEGDPPQAVVVVPCTSRPLTYRDALARRALVLSGNSQNRFPYTVRIELA